VKTITFAMIGVVRGPRRAARRVRAGARRAFTLIEVLLALALAVLLLSAVGIAIDVHLRAQSAGRAQVEEAQLARTLLQLIADDLYRVVPYDPQQDQRYKIAWPGISTLPAEGFDDPALEAAADAAGFETELDELADAVEGLDSDPASQPVSTGPAGLYGDAWALQLDISRLPRVDALQATWQVQDASLPPQSLSAAVSTSDLKTVTYYVADNTTGVDDPAAVSAQSSQGTATAGTGSAGLAGTGGGLVRRELDRQAAVFAVEQGLLWTNDQNENLAAPEVVAVQFRYFDGVEWFDEWDSEAKGGLPMAVEIGLTLRRANAETGPPPAALSPLDADACSLGRGYAVYRRTVYLPAAVPTSTAVAGTTGEADTTGETDTTGQFGEGTGTGSQPQGGGAGDRGSGGPVQPSGGGTSGRGSGGSAPGPAPEPGGGPGGGDSRGDSGAGRGSSPAPPGPGTEEDDSRQQAPR